MQLPNQRLQNGSFRLDSVHRNLACLVSEDGAVPLPNPSHFHCAGEPARAVVEAG